MPINKLAYINLSLDMKRSLQFIVILIVLFSGGVAAQDSSIIKSKAPSSAKQIVIKYGTASFYHEKFNGRKTANGSIYDSKKLTAACNILPLGTWVKVTNLKNEKSVVVQINDRLHHKNMRLIDLTKTAAKQLDFFSRGLTKVKVEVLGRLKIKK